MAARQKTTQLCHELLAQSATDMAAVEVLLEEFTRNQVEGKQDVASGRSKEALLGSVEQLIKLAAINEVDEITLSELTVELTHRHPDVVKISQAFDDFDFGRSVLLLTHLKQKLTLESA